MECENSSDEEIETAKAWLRRAAEAHPKRPTIQIHVSQGLEDHESSFPEYASYHIV